jgi:hypothetical protein
MKFRIGCFVVVFFSLVLSMHATTCSQATVDGEYALANGDGSALFLGTYDGVSKFAGAGVENFYGTGAVNVTVNGTYSVSADCAFTFTATDNLGNTASVSGSIMENGAEIVGFLDIEIDSRLVSFTAYRLKKTQCTEASAKGSFVQEAQFPLTPAGPALVTGQGTVNSKGAESGSAVTDFNGTIGSNTFTGTISMNSDCTFTRTEYLPGGPTVHWFGVGGISQNGVASLLMITDSGWIGLDTRY